MLKASISLFMVAGTLAVKGHAQTIPVDADIIFSAPGNGETAQMLFLSVRINGQEREGSFLFARFGPLLFGRKADLERWRLNVGATKPVIIQGQEFVALGDIEGVKISIQEESQTALLEVSANRFNPDELKAPTLARPTPSAFSAFLNYDVMLQQESRFETSALIETGISDDWGLFSNSLLIETGRGSGATRLDTYFLRDVPGGLERAVV
ncbi:MAG: hypothetical protein AB7V46_00655, partial [Thermomicrobiales bacterium]